MPYGTFASYELYYDSIYADEGGLKVATLILDTRTYEMDVMFIEPGGKQAPDWFDEHDLELVVDQIREMLQPTPDGAVEVLEPEGPEFHLVHGPVFQAESLTTARHMCFDFGPELTNLYQAFTVEFRPNVKRPGTFPVAVFVANPREGRIRGHIYGEDNPFAPVGTTRQQHRIIARRLHDLLDTVARGGSPDAPVSPFKNMGPQFRSEALPTVEGRDIGDALDRAVAMLEEWGATEAS